jgi:hypothetical protein
VEKRRTGARGDSFTAEAVPREKRGGGSGDAWRGGGALDSRHDTGTTVAGRANRGGRMGGSDAVGWVARDGNGSGGPKTRPVKKLCRMKAPASTGEISNPHPHPQVSGVHRVC